MSSIPGLPEGTIVRVLVLKDLGAVRKGDHILVVGGEYALALDTSRHPDDLINPPVGKMPKTNHFGGDAAPPKTKPLKTVKIDVTKDDVQRVVIDRGITEAREIGDLLGLERRDSSNRSRITRFLKMLRDQGRVVLVSEKGNYKKYAPAAELAASSA